MGLVIRDQQMDAFRRDRERQFENRALDHLRRNLPRNTTAQLGEDALRSSIRKAITKGRVYEITEEYDFLRYLNLMHALGSEFDTDPRYPWAAGILNNEKLTARRKLDMLTARAMDMEAEQRGKYYAAAAH